MTDQKYYDVTFHNHLDVCRQCREQPFNLCEFGSHLLKQAVADLEIKAGPARAPDQGGGVTKRDAKVLALEDAARNIEGSTDLIEQRYPDFTASQRVKIEQAYDELAKEIRARVARLKNTNPRT